MDMSCAAVREVLPAYVRDGDGSLSVRRHLSRCTACRADLTHYEHLLASLTAMESAVAGAPAGLRASLLEIPARSGRIETVRAHVAENRKAYVSGAAVLLAGAAGAALWKSRGRRFATA